MKVLLFTTLLTICSAAFANDLAEANRLSAAQSYDKALPIYQKLAERGDVLAQMRLGEMYWFGEGTAPDLREATFWFGKSASAGNADAAASLASLKRREAHGDELLYWMQNYDGADLISGKYACKKPKLPTMSFNRPQIVKVDAAIQTYTKCYNAFVDNVNATMASGNRIPVEVLGMMTPAEERKAQAHLESVYATIVADARHAASAFAVGEAAWRAQTEQFVMAESARPRTGPGRAGSDISSARISYPAERTTYPTTTGVR